MKNTLIVLLLSSFSLLAQTGDKNCEILLKINSLLQQEHFKPKPINDSLSVYLFDELLSKLDPSKSIFLKTQVDSLGKKYRYTLDNYLLKNDCSFISDIQQVYKKSLLRNKAIYEKMQQQTLDFGIKDTIRFKKNDSLFKFDANTLEKILNKRLRFEILSEIAEKSKNLDSLKQNFTALSLESKEGILNNELCKINFLLSEKKSLEENVYNVFCSYFDPHTNYFSNDTKSSFVSTLSKEKLSLGLDVSLNEKNQIIVDEIDPNGPAFKTGKIKKGDQIMAVSNQKETLEVSCSSLESIAILMSSELNTDITLTLKRNAGKNFKVNIQKQVLKDEENTVYSFIINKGIKVGYIKIPSFYTNFEQGNGKGCAQDVAKETIKLMKDNIKGLVLDLTDNGGGSMEEAVKLAGLFIDYGPISIVADNKMQLSLINDPFRGVIYRGPIVIIINGNSASASEFCASIMQDYNRALLIGNTTLGKATMQTIVPLEKDDNEHFVKLTISKFYRVTGKSHQGTGVVPDVQIPSIYQDVMTKEKDFPTALKNESLTTNVPFTPYVTDSFIESLAVKSRERVANSPYFKAVTELNSKIDTLINRPKFEIPVTLDAVFDNTNKIINLTDEITNFKADDLKLNVSNSEYNKNLLKLYPSLIEYNTLQLESLRSNHYINEAIYIIEDYKVLKQNKAN